MATRPLTTESIFSRPLAPDADVSNVSDPVDMAGKGVLDMIQRAASTAKESSKQALSAVHELTVQLQTAASRIKELEAKVSHYQDRAERAEKWFHHISAELQRQFLEKSDNRTDQVPPPHVLMTSFRTKNSL